MNNDMNAKNTFDGKQITYTEYIVKLFDFLDRETYTDDEIIEFAKGMYFSLYDNYNMWDQEYFKWVATDWSVMKETTGHSLEELFNLGKSMLMQLMTAYDITKVSDIPHIKTIITAKIEDEWK